MQSALHLCQHATSACKSLKRKAARRLKLHIKIGTTRRPHVMSGPRDLPARSGKCRYNRTLIDTNLSELARCAPDRSSEGRSKGCGASKTGLVRNKIDR